MPPADHVPGNPNIDKLGSVGKPVLYCEVRIVKAKRAFTLRRVIVAALVDDLGFRLKGRKSMGKPSRDEQLATILKAELYPKPLAIGRRPRTNINRHIEEPPPTASYEFCLGVWRRLKV